MYLQELECVKYVRARSIALNAEDALLSPLDPEVKADLDIIEGQLKTTIMELTNPNVSRFSCDPTW